MTHNVLMILRPLLFVVVVASTLSACTIERRTGTGVRPTDAEIVALIDRSVADTSWGDRAKVEGLEINPYGTIACGFVTTPGQPPLVLQYIDLDFTDDESVVSFGVIPTIEDFGTANTRRFAQAYLATCRGYGLLTGPTPPGWTSAPARMP